MSFRGGNIIFNNYLGKKEEISWFTLSRIANDIYQIDKNIYNNNRHMYQHINAGKVVCKNVITGEVVQIDKKLFDADENFVIVIMSYKSISIYVTLILSGLQSNLAVCCPFNHPKIILK